MTLENCWRLNGVETIGEKLGRRNTLVVSTSCHWEIVVERESHGFPHFFEANHMLDYIVFYFIQQYSQVFFFSFTLGGHGSNKYFRKNEKNIIIG